MSFDKCVALLSAATPYVNVPTAESLGLQAADVICTRLEVAGGVVTGNVIEPICARGGLSYSFTD